MLRDGHLRAVGVLLTLVCTSIYQSKVEPPATIGQHSGISEMPASYTRTAATTNIPVMQRDVIIHNHFTRYYFQGRVNVDRLFNLAR